MENYSNIQIEKLRACCIGAALAESFGMPAESLSPEEIREHYGKIELMLPRQESENFPALPAGSTAKQTEALLSVLKASRILPVLQEFAFNIKDAHNRKPEKWPKSTTFPWPPFPDGGHYSLSFAIPAGWLHSQNQVDLDELQSWLQSLEPVSSVWQQAVWVYLRVLGLLFNTEPSEFYGDLLLKKIRLYIDEAENLVPNDFKLRKKMQLVEPIINNSPEEIGRVCGEVDIAAENILIFSLAMLYQNPDSFEDAILKAVNAGGATEASSFYLGSLLGALHGQGIFPQKWLDQLSELERVNKEVDQYLEKAMMKN